MKKSMKLLSIAIILIFTFQLFLAVTAASLPDDDFGYSAYFKGNIKMSGDSKIYGSAVSSTGTISLFNSANITGTQFDKSSGKSFDYTPTNLPDAPSIAKQVTTFEVKGGDTGTISEDCKYATIDIGGGIANIDCSSDRVLVTSTLNLHNNGQIKLFGNGKLTLYVTGNVTIDTFNINTSGNSDRVNIFVVNPNTKLNISSTLLMNGNWYLKNEVNFTKGGSVINGNIVSAGIRLTLDYGTTINGAVYMPNAIAAITGNAVVNGYVIGNTLTMDNSGRINFKGCQIFDPNTYEYINGILGEYYDSANNEVSSAKRVTRVDDSPNFNWGYDTSPDPVIELETFSSTWTGYITVPQDGNYTFYTFSDDGVKLTINGQKIIDRFGLVDLEFTSSSQITLQANVKYSIKFEYQEMPLYSTVFLFDKIEGGNMELVPDSAYYIKKEVKTQYASPVYSNLVKGTGTGLKTEYFAGSEGVNNGSSAVSTVTGNVDKDWAKNPPVAGIADNLFSARFTGYIEGKYTGTTNLIFVVDDGIKVWINDVLVLNKWNLSAKGDYSVPVNLVNGQKTKIKIEYNNIVDEAAIHMLWKSDAQELQIVPAKYLYVTNS